MATVEAALLTAALGGVAALLGHRRALALIVLWAVAGVTLALLRPARLRDTVTLARETRAFIAALGLLPLAIPPLSAWAERTGLWPLPGGATLHWTGVALTAAGLAIRIHGMTQLGVRFTPNLVIQPGHVLETRGLYRHIRHPGYLGAWVAALGGAIAFGSILGLALALIFGALLRLRARREEDLLEQHFGEAWRVYCARTGAFLPRFIGS